MSGFVNVSNITTFITTGITTEGIDYLVNNDDDGDNDYNEMGSEFYNLSTTILPDINNTRSSYSDKDQELEQRRQIIIHIVVGLLFSLLSALGCLRFKITPVSSSANRRLGTIGNHHRPHCRNYIIDWDNYSHLSTLHNTLRHIDEVSDTRQNATRRGRMYGNNNDDDLPPEYETLSLEQLQQQQQQQQPHHQLQQQQPQQSQPGASALV